MNPNFPQISLDLNEPETETKEDNTMNELIQITAQPINGQTVQTVNARDLHVRLEIRKDFSDWIKVQLEIFSQGTDYVVLPFSGELGNHAGFGAGRRIEYALSIDCAKHIAMMSRTEKGRQLRDYFIECERRAKANISALPDFTNPVLAARAWADAQEQKLLALKQVSELTPMAAALDLISASHENMPIRIAAKVLDIKEQRLIQDLVAWHWIYRLNQSWAPYKEHIDSGDLVMKFAKYHNSDGQEVEKPYCHITPKGLAKLAKKYGVQLPEAA